MCVNVACMPWRAAMFGERDFDFKTSGLSISISQSLYLCICMFVCLAGSVPFSISAYLSCFVSLPTCMYMYVYQSICISLPLYLSVLCLPFLLELLLSAKKCRSHSHRFNTQRPQCKDCLKIYTKAPFPLYIHCTGCSPVIGLHYGVCT